MQQFIHYISNPSGYEKKDKLWDQLEAWDKANTRPVIQKMVKPDDFDWDEMSGTKHVIGNTCYIHIKNDDDEDDEKKEPIDVD